jgi:hypothetical protein
MAKLAYCSVCNATYPLVVLTGESGRSAKGKDPVCPMGHTEVREVEPAS